jgi:hypothetical protein
MKNTKKAKQGRKFFRLFLPAVVAGIMVLSPAFIFAKTIDVDGDFSDWDDVATLVDEGGFSGTSSEFSANGTTYYFNTDGGNWTTIPFANACKVNYDYMVAVNFLKMTNDNNFLYLLWERGTDFMDFRWDNGSGGGNYYIYSHAVPSTAPNGEFTGTPPCAGFSVTAPAAFDHDMVISVDKDKDGDYDYYLVINIQYPAGWTSDESDYETTGYILEDNGNGAYDGISSETMKTTFGDSGFEIGISTASNVGVRQEWRMSVNQIFTDLGLDWGDSVNVRYEAHSLSPSDTTPVENYTFSQGKVLKLKVNNKKKTRKSSIRINGKTVRGATIEVFAGDENQGTVSVSRGGTFHKNVNLAVGSNTIRVFASHATKGSKNVTKTITRR